MQLLANQLVQIEGLELNSISPEAVRQTLKQTNSSPGVGNNGSFHPDKVPNLSLGWKTFWIFITLPMIQTIGWFVSTKAAGNWWRKNVFRYQQSRDS
ncbi:MAG: hypothetical protein QGG39_08530 [Candidatus Poribacteria bacterium]|nr:hypothetical protein [Candidatus Poribacteria bacterium]